MNLLRTAMAPLLLASAILCAQAKTESLAAADQRWINEDVAYLASDAERAQFLSLQDEAARDNFVRNFWEQRNPEPGNPENVFREEHYRRIAYANAHFASTQAGWKTDRGARCLLGKTASCRRRSGTTRVRRFPNTGAT